MEGDKIFHSSSEFIVFPFQWRLVYKLGLPKGERLPFANVETRTMTFFALSRN